MSKYSVLVELSTIRVGHFDFFKINLLLIIKNYYIFVEIC